MALNLLFTHAQDEASAIEFLQEKNVLRKVPPKCPTCNKCMTLIKGGTGRRSELIYRCPRHKNKKESLRKHSYWYHCKIPLKKIVELLFLWSFKIPIYNVVELTGLGHVSIGSWFQSFRDICSIWLSKNPQQIGGPGVVVEVDEIRVVKRKEDESHEPMWVFGGVERTSGRGFLKLVRDKSAATLLPIIQRHIIPGSCIHSRSDPAYNNLQNQVNPPYEHIITNARTSCVERYWKTRKAQFKPMCGVADSSLASHLDELLWRDIHGKNGGETTLNNLLLHLSQWLPLNQE